MASRNRIQKRLRSLNDTMSDIGLTVEGIGGRYRISECQRVRFVSYWDDDTESRGRARRPFPSGRSGGPIVRKLWDLIDRSGDAGISLEALTSLLYGDDSKEHRRRTTALLSKLRRAIENHTQYKIQGPRGTYRIALR